MADLEEGDRPVDDVDSGAEDQRHCEWLAAGVVAVSAALLLRGYFQAWIVSRTADDLAVGFGAQGPRWWQIIELAATGATANFSSGVGTAVVTSAALVLAHALVLIIGPGRDVGRVGLVALQGLVATATLVVLNGLVTTQAILRGGGEFAPYSIGPTGADQSDTLTKVLDRSATALPVVAGSVVAGLVAFLTVRWLLPDGETDDAADAPPTDRPVPDEPYVDPYGFDPKPPADPA